MAGCQNQSVRKYKKKFIATNICHIEFIFYIIKGPVKLMQRVKIAHLFLQSVPDLFHFIILSLLM